MTYVKDDDPPPRFHRSGIAAQGAYMNRKVRRSLFACLAIAATSFTAISSANAEIVYLHCGGDVWIDFDRNVLVRQWYAEPSIEYHTFPVVISNLAYEWDETEGWHYRIDRSTGLFAGDGPGGKKVRLPCSRGSKPMPVPKF